MKILHLILTTRFAGSERYAVELANAQARDHDVTLVLRKADAEKRDDAIIQHVSDKVNLVLLHDFMLFSHFQIRSLLKRQQADVVHAHLSRGCRALSSIKKDDMLRIATLHIHYKPAQHARLDALIAIVPAQLQQIPEPLKIRSRHINNWTCARPAPRETGMALRQQWQIPEHHRVVGSLGRVEHSKGTEMLVQGFLDAAAPDTTLVIVGQGKSLSELQNRYSNASNVRFVGFSAQPQQWLAGFDLFVSAARSEPFGLVFLEAMVAGLPVLATATQGARHLASYFPFPLVTTDNQAALTEGLKQALARPLPRKDYDLSAFDYYGRVAEIEQFYQQARQQCQSAI